jgi:hypothetical protein
VNVVVASGDDAFRRLAGAALTRAGYQVRTISARPGRVERLIELRWPDVIVLEDDAELATEIKHHVAGLAEQPGLVLVSEKWRPVETLVSDVERAAARNATPTRRHLRLVTDEG